MSDDSDDLLAETFLDDLTDGAAADSANSESEHSHLPRLLRYVVAARRGSWKLRHQLLAEIIETAPKMEETAARWMAGEDDDGRALSAALDNAAVQEDRPELRSLADVARLLSAPASSRYRADHRRIALAIALCEREHRPEFTDELYAEIACISIGWAVLAAGAYHDRGFRIARDLAQELGSSRTQAIAQAARREERRKHEEKDQAVDELKPALAALSKSERVPSEGFVRVCSLSEAEKKNPKLKELIRGHEHVIGANVPLISVPDLREVREKLLFEFPYAEEAIDFALSDLIGRKFVHLRPLLLVGPPGGGKSRFARRLGEALNVGVWRTDASSGDGGAFGGTAKRWYTAEPSHAFLAISRAKHANPVIILDELEKAATRSDYGRLWDVLLGLLEPETASRYPDPALQCSTDLSHISYIATANAIEPLPAPLRDRFRVVLFPEPRKIDLDALLPPVLADIASERGLVREWIAPLLGWERDCVAAHWRGGSVRRLRRYVETIVRAREHSALRQ